MSQIGGRAAKAAVPVAEKESPIQQVYKGSLVDIFKHVPQDTTVDKSKYESYSQIGNAVQPLLQINIPRTRAWIDLSKTQFEFNVEFLQNAGALLANVDNAVPCNNIGHTLIRSFKLLINNNPVSVDHNHYCLEAYFDRLLNYTEKEKETWLTMEGWYGDEAGKFDDRNPMTTEVRDRPNAAAFANPPTGPQLQAWFNESERRRQPNKGLAARHKLCCQNRAVKFILRPAIPVLGCKRFSPLVVK